METLARAAESGPLALAGVPDGGGDDDGDDDDGDDAVGEDDADADHDDDDGDDDGGDGGDEVPQFYIYTYIYIYIYKLPINRTAAVMLVGSLYNSRILVHQSPPSST